jgi:DNA-binding response OmpR family regulator
MSAVVFVPGDGRLLWNGLVARLTPQECQILGVLRQGGEHFMPLERIGSAIWPGQFPQDLKNSIAVPVCNMRRKIVGWPVTIENQWGYGYRLMGKLEIG